MTQHQDPETPGIDPASLVFLPLGGAGEIGMNLNLYGCDGKWLMVDLGITFADDTMPGIDLLTPDPSWIADRAEDLVGLVLTHAHEDHLGAVPHLWPELECPVYATPFAAALLRRKLSEFGLEGEVPIHELRPDEALALGPFRITPVGLTHSIPEMRALSIETRHGRVLHTGDWKLDPDPLVGPASDLAALERMGDEGVLALVCDSTNALSPGTSGSEADVRRHLTDLVAKQSGRVAIATFASNVARVETVGEVAKATGRRLCIVGRSLHRIMEVSRECGYLGDMPDLVDERDVGYLPREEVLLLCTGCQGEPRGAMTRIAGDSHPNITLAPGDTTIFSSKIIPGNERTLFALHNLLASRGIEVLTEKDAPIHVSGHPCRDELAEMYRIVRPRIAVPVHGEARHLISHAALARSLGVGEAVVTRNGHAVRLSPGRPAIVAEVPAGRLAVDGEDLVLPDGPVLRTRRRLMRNGAVFVTLALDGKGLPVGEPMIALSGVAEDDDGALAGEAGEAVLSAVRRLSNADRNIDEMVEDAARRAVRRMVRGLNGRRPIVEVHLVRMTGVKAA